MALGDEVFQPIKLADGNGQHEHHRKAGVDSPSHKVGRENRGVPAGQNADGEVKADDRVYRQH